MLRWESAAKPGGLGCYKKTHGMRRPSEHKDAGSYHSGRGVGTCIQLQRTRRTGYAEAPAQRMGKVGENGKRRNRI